MTSPSPLLYNTYYHIYNRGNNGENIFIQERNYHYFYNLYIKYTAPLCETFAYCLLRNHFHLLVCIKSKEEIEEALKPKESLSPDYPSRHFSNFFNAYAKAINVAYGRKGSLFQHPFGRVMITNERQFWNVVTYIHQNPQKHKFVDDFRDWKYSSYGIMLSEKPTKLNRSTVLDWFGGKEQFVNMHKEWAKEEESRWFAEED